MHLQQALAYLFEFGGSLFLRNRSLFLYQVIQTAFIHVFHYDVKTVIFNKIAVDFDNVRIIEKSLQFDLTYELFLHFIDSLE